jgi:hypothetical protein
MYVCMYVRMYVRFSSAVLWQQKQSDEMVNPTRGTSKTSSIVNVFW